MHVLALVLARATKIMAMWRLLTGITMIVGIGIIILSWRSALAAGIIVTLFILMAWLLWRERAGGLPSPKVR